jgi:hypothetical protein
MIPNLKCNKTNAGNAQRELPGPFGDNSHGAERGKSAKISKPVLTLTYSKTAASISKRN